MKSLYHPYPTNANGYRTIIIKNVPLSYEFGQCFQIHVEVVNVNIKSGKGKGHKARI